MKKTSIIAKDGHSIPVLLHNVNEENKKGIIIICHGFSEYSDYFSEVAALLWSGGYACVVFNQRGHGEPPNGLSYKKWFGITPDYQRFIDDVISITEYIKETAPDTPVILYGFSMGGNITVNTFLQLPQEKVNLYTCMVLESPWFGLYKKYNALTVYLVKILNRLAPNFTIASNLDSTVFSDENNNTPDYNNDVLYHGRISMRMLLGIYNAGIYAINNAHSLPLPTFLAYADKDTIISNESIKIFAKNAGDKVELKEYCSKHAIHDGMREQFCRDLIMFLDLHCNN